MKENRKKMVDLRADKERNRTKIIDIWLCGNIYMPPNRINTQSKNKSLREGTLRQKHEVIEHLKSGEGHKRRSHIKNTRKEKRK